MHPRPEGARFWENVDAPKDASGEEPDYDACWWWLGGKVSGYGCFYSDKGRVRAHRWSYEWALGPIPPGLTLDHLCRNRACVNPLHLEPVTRGENVLRGVGVAATNAAKTHCRNGHPFSDGNTYLWRGHRHCKECARVKTYGPGIRMRCQAGHLLSGENLRVATNGRRICRACNSARIKRWKEGHQRNRTHCPAGHPYPSADTGECRICSRARSKQWKEKHQDRTLCPAGHPLTGDNVHLYNNGKSRGCRTCEAERAAKRVRPTHCPSGHPLSGDNLYTSPDGLRFCRICGRERTKRWRDERRAGRKLDGVVSGG